MRNIIFDLDGTIIDSHECIFGIYKKLFSELNMPCPDEETLRTFIGPPVEYVLSKYICDETDRNAACNRFRQLYSTVDLKQSNVIYDGVREMLSGLWSAGKRLFIASTKNEGKANLIADLFDIKKYFIAVYGSRPELNRLTKQQVINELCEEHDINKHDAVLIGDTHFDAEGADLAGVPVGIVKYGFGNADRLKEYNVTKYFDTPIDVMNYYLQQ